MSKSGRVLVAMSGGVDSGLACALLHEAGYEVIGVTMKTWDYALAGRTHKKETGCCSLGAINDAREVAVSLGLPHYVLDIRGDFRKHVTDYFVREYLQARTPNPCVMCNTHIKWEVLLRKANQLHCDWIATGHYARIGTRKGRYWIREGKDSHKDQSYALWGVQQESLARTLFPLGTLTKSSVKAMAKERGFTYLLSKSESYELCFIPDNDYRAFLRRNVSAGERGLTEGHFVGTDGNILGRHKGYAFYTVGQRKGLGITLGYPAYVVGINRRRNQVILGALDDLARKGMYVHRLNFMKYPRLSEPHMDVRTKIRYNHRGTSSTLEQAGNMMKVSFPDGVHGVTPGQAAVFYEGEDVVGGGWIHSSFSEAPCTASHAHNTHNL